MQDPVIALDHDDALGEGPAWDPRTNRLTWVDIKRRRVQAWAPGDDVEVTELPAEVSLALPATNGGSVVSQVDRLFLADGAELTALCDIDPETGSTRLNDACCDQQGRLWVGTYSTRGQPEGAVFEVRGDGRSRQVLGGLVAANGMAWTPDGSGVWVTDTGRGRIDLYELCGDRLEVNRPLLEADGSPGRPDGIALDREGAVWVAMWGGGHLRRYHPDGTLTHTVPVPVTYPTSVAFGGPDLATLYVTTSSHHLRAGHTEAHAGSLLALTPEVPGLPTAPFEVC